MKKILLTLFTLCLFVGCKKNIDPIFEANIDSKLISFKPIAGGAIMSYNIPESKSIYAINLTYTSERGQKMTVAGSYGSKELTVKGFINKNTSVPAEVRYISRDNRMSKPIYMTFSTLESGTVSIFKNMKVKPYWDGFSVEFNAPEDSDGLINIGYMGINPMTGKYDIILKETRVITPGDNKVMYSNISTKNEVIKTVIWTEDMYQNEAKKVSYDVIPKLSKMADQSTLTYEGNSYESEYYKIGSKYLFDGDKIGLKHFNLIEGNGNYFFATKNPANTKPEGVIDLQEPKILASFRTYTPLHQSTRYFGSASLRDRAMPNHFELFASNNKEINSEDWVKIGEYYQSDGLEEVFWWCYPQFDPAKEYKELESLKEAQPCYANVNFDVSNIKYRYVKVRFLSNFKYSTSRAVSSEIEIFVEK